ncbi:hypothetical protein [Streptomyces sp. NPDC051452]|uniref:hypothetical protein n=1 Tax=Streptomyces sp. NPDC051452 TaxID=3365654 RepID=UPI0037AEF72A
MQPVFTRGFRLHLSDSQYLDGAEFPSGRVFVLDDPEYGFATVATSLEHLLEGYHGATVEWPAVPVEAHPAREAWRVEYRHADVWLPVRPTSDRQRAADDLTRRRQRHPEFEFRLVHVTTNYTVEES